MIVCVFSEMTCEDFVDFRGIKWYNSLEDFKKELISYIEDNLDNKDFKLVLDEENHCFTIKDEDFEDARRFFIDTGSMYFGDFDFLSDFVECFTWQIDEINDVSDRLLGKSFGFWLLDLEVSAIEKK